MIDTTYRTNKYRKPLVVFTGINNHFSSIVFDCALVSDEKDETYVWVLNKLLDAMNGKKPISVLTAMRKAITIVLPEARQIVCLAP